MKNLKDIIFEKLHVSAAARHVIDITKIDINELDIEYLGQEYDDVGFGHIMYWINGDPVYIGVFVFNYEYGCAVYWNDKVFVKPIDVNPDVLNSHINGANKYESGCPAVQEVLKLVRNVVDSKVRFVDSFEEAALDEFIENVPVSTEWKIANSLSNFLNDELDVDTTPEQFYDDDQD